MSNPSRRVLLGTAVLLSLVACHKEAPTDAVPAPTPATDQVLQKKLNASIECLNKNSSQLFEARAAYLKEVDPAAGPTPGKQVAMLGVSDGCRERLAAAAALAPAAAELDQAATAYVAALAAAKIAWDKQDGYFKSGEFKADGGKKGGEQHAQLMAALGAFATAHRALDERVRIENRRVREADLAAREKSGGRTIRIVLDSLMLEAETVIEALPAKPDLALQLDVAAYEAKMARYAKLVDELDAHAAAHPDQAKTIGSLDNIRNYAKTYLGALRTVVAKLRDKAAPTADEMTGVDRQYNSLVDNYNHH